MTSSSNLQIKPAGRNTLTQEVADQILSLILEGNLRPGDRLPSQSELAARFQVGHSTIREALRILNAMGLMEFRQGRGTFIRELNARSMHHPEILARMVTPETTKQLFEARQIIEPEIAALAAQRATAEDLAAMDQALREYEKALSESRPVYRLSVTFHRTIALATHSQILCMFMDSILVPLAERGLLLENQPGYLEWEVDSHRSLYQAISSRDPDRARAMMIKHLQEAQTRVARLLPQG